MVCLIFVYCILTLDNYGGRMYAQSPDSGVLEYSRPV
jgi:hypothetical protein